MGELSVQVALSMLVIAVTFCASGLGRFVLRDARAGNQVRTVAAQYLIGLLLFSTFFAVAAHLQLPLRVVTWLLGLLAVTGLWCALQPSLARAVTGSAAPGDVRVRSAIAALLGLSFLVASATPVNPTALDPTTYAYMTALLFQEGWATTNLTVLPDYGWLQGAAQEGVFSRAPALSLLWPGTALGLSLGARSTAAAAAWFLAPTFAALVDVLEGRAPLLARIILATGAIGVFNEVAVLVDGQVNQTFAVAVMVATVWGYRWLEPRRARWLLLILAGANIAAGYPEFLPAVPLYLLCCALQRTRGAPFKSTAPAAAMTLRALLLDAAAFCGGLVVVQLSTHLENAAYLLRQVDVAPGWWPLPQTPTNVGEVWLSVLVQRPPPAIVALVLLPVAWYAWRSTDFSAPRATLASRSVWAIVAALVVSLGVWSWLALRSPNQNYATFKLGGWLGPGLFMCAVLLTGYATPTVRRTLATSILLLATTRVLGLAIDTPAKIMLYERSHASPRVWDLQQQVSGSGVCVLHLGSEENRDVMRALAETAAPSHGCALVSLQRPVVDGRLEQ